MRARAIATTLAVLQLALISSCSEESVTNTSPEYSRDTPAALAKALAYSIEYRDISVYDECLHDEYLFTFVSFDAEFVGLPEDEPWWGKTEDVNAMSVVFNNPVVVGIECAIEVNSGPWPTEHGFIYRLEPDMLFTATRSLDYEGMVLSVQDYWFDVEIVADPYETGKWVFKGIDEASKGPWSARSDPGPGPMAYSSTFGIVKALFGQ